MYKQKIILLFISCFLFACKTSEINSKTKEKTQQEQDYPVSKEEDMRKRTELNE